MFPDLKVQKKLRAQSNFQLNCSSPMKSTCPCCKKTKAPLPMTSNKACYDHNILCVIVMRGA